MQNGKCDEEIKRRIAMAKSLFCVSRECLKEHEPKIRLKKANTRLLCTTNSCL